MNVSDLDEHQIEELTKIVVGSVLHTFHVGRREDGRLGLAPWMREMPLEPGGAAYFFHAVEVAKLMSKRKSFLPHQLNVLVHEAEVLRQEHMKSLEAHPRTRGTWKIVFDVLEQGVAELRRLPSWELKMWGEDFIQRIVSARLCLEAMARRVT